MNEAFLDELRALGPALLDEPLHRHNTFGIGGPADVYFAARSEEQLRAALRAAHQHDVPVFILGAGSNVLILDGGIRGVVIENATEQVEGPAPNGAGFRVRAASGVSFAALARRLSFAGYGGIEWACGIPGTLGGAAVYNAGAYGKSLLDNLKGIRVVDPQNGILELRPEELTLDYRNSAFTRGALKGHVVLSVDLSVQKGDPDELRARVRELDARRLAAQPRGRNAGSMFKNPAEHPAWWLVDQVGLRGHRIGNTEIS
ncbi:MAG: UDP-N-acetylmuramate dehydrogenase, partial [Chloroflexi bacterium]|nr:UDP-N-acetylmuramate dehydrogenase [Chloroflexota bacterium]